jgi:hypothetical protein
MKAMRERRRAKGLREIRIVGPDLRDPAVRDRIAEQIRQLDPADEEESLRWIEAVSMFDETR